MVRIELVDFPKPWALFYAMAALSLGYLSYAFFRLWQGISRGMEPAATEGGGFFGSARNPGFPRSFFSGSFTPSLFTAGSPIC